MLQIVQSIYDMTGELPSQASTSLRPDGSRSPTFPGEMVKLPPDEDTAQKVGSSEQCGTANSP